MAKIAVEGGPLDFLQKTRGRTVEEIQKLAKSGRSDPPPTEERVPAPGDPDYKPLESESPVRNPDRWAQLRYAAEQSKRDQE